MQFQLIKGKLALQDKLLIFYPKKTFLQRIFIKKIKLKITNIQEVIVRKQVNTIYLELKTKKQSLALLFDKKTGKFNHFIDELIKQNTAITIIEKLSDSTNYCHESCCYYKNE